MNKKQIRELLNCNNSELPKLKTGRWINGVYVIHPSRDFYHILEEHNTLNCSRTEVLEFLECNARELPAMDAVKRFGAYYVVRYKWGAYYVSNFSNKRDMSRAA